MNPGLTEAQSLLKFSLAAAAAESAKLGSVLEKLSFLRHKVCLGYNTNAL